MSDPDKCSIIYRTEGNPAPGELLRVHGFLNTWSNELGIEDFSTPRDTEKWLRAAGLWNGIKRLNQNNYQRVLGYRDLIRRCVLNRDQMAELGQAVAHITFNLNFQDKRIVLIPKTKTECDNVLGQLSATIYNSIVDGTWARFKCCALPSCGWAYYDTTRSRTKGGAQ